MAAMLEARPIAASGGGANESAGVAAPPTYNAAVTTKREPLAELHDPVRAWFLGSFKEPTAAQSKGWPPILE